MAALDPKDLVDHDLKVDSEPDAELHSKLEASSVCELISLSSLLD